MSETASPSRKPLPPYLPFKTFLNALESWRVVLPNRIDRGVMGSYAGTMQTWVIGTLRYLGLIDDAGAPTETLKRLVLASEAERVHIFADLVKRYYPFLFTTGFDLARATPSQLREKFDATGATGETAVKAISFFSGLAKAGHVPMSPFVKTRQRRQGNGRKTVRKADSAQGKMSKGGGVKPPTSHDEGSHTAQPRTAFEMLYEMLDLEGMEDTEQQAVWTLLRYLKKRGAP